MYTFQKLISSRFINQTYPVFRRISAFGNRFQNSHSTTTLVLTSVNDVTTTNNAIDLGCTTIGNIRFTALVVGYASSVYVHSHCVRQQRYRYDVHNHWVC